MSTKTSGATTASISSHLSTPNTARSPDFKRRRFLCALGASGAGAAVIATQTLAAPMVPAVAEAAAETAQGYRETEHIRDYYATTRI